MVSLSSNGKVIYYSLFLIVILISIAFRFPDLTVRPMHTDEAVQAVKFGELLENNYYRYDSAEYHGPTLYYFTLIPAWIQSAANIKEIDEKTVRSVTAVFGIMLTCFLLFLRDGLSRRAVIASGLLTAVSPAMVFYSRYYIQEMLLVFFSFAVIVSGYRYIRGRNMKWALATGVSLGLLHATKETSIIIAGSMVLALMFTFLMQKQSPGDRQASSAGFNLRHVLAFFASAFVVSALFYSSFFTNPAGIADSYLTFLHYLGKAANNDWHVHPWYYYLKILTVPGGFSLPVWSEVLVLLLAGTGFYAVTSAMKIPGSDSALLRFISFYTIILMIIYSVIPYKTPWLLLGFLHGLLLLAGVGAAVILNLKTGRTLKVFAVFLLAAGGFHLANQSYLLNSKYMADPSNPYVYAHTSQDIFPVVELIENLAAVHPDGKNMYIQVVRPGNDYWPLPWYLRSYANVGWWDNVAMDVPAAPVIIASPEVERDILKKLYETPPPGERDLYLPLFDSYTELRHMVELTGYVKKDLWDRYIRSIAK